MWKLLQSWIPRIPDAAFYVCLGAIIIDQLTRRTALPFELLDDDTRLAVGAAALASFAFLLGRDLATLRRLAGQASAAQTGILEVLRPGTRPNIEELLMVSRKLRILTLSGSRTANLGSETVLTAIRNPHRKTELTILLGDPYSEAVLSRYDRDEPTTYEAGIDGIKRRLVALHALLEDLPPALKERTTILVYDCYPTQAIVEADGNSYVTPYGYKLRGVDCPTIHALPGSSLSFFVDQQLKKVVGCAKPLHLWYQEHRPSIEHDE